MEISAYIVAEPDAAPVAARCANARVSLDLADSVDPVEHLDLRDAREVRLRDVLAVLATNHLDIFSLSTRCTNLVDTKAPD